MDTRIYSKQCKALAEAGCEVVLIAADAENGDSEGVSIRGVPKPRNRLNRITITVWKTFREALRQRADIYHFHDPELLLAGLLLKMLGKRVIYDVHEDLPRQMLTKYWIPAWSRRLLSCIVERLENFAARWMDGVVAVTPTIARRFNPRKTVIVCNYPRLEDFASSEVSSYSDRPANVAYVGGISRERGSVEMIQAMSFLPKEKNVRLKLGGSVDPPKLENELKSLSGFENTDLLGFLSQRSVSRLLAEVRVGLVVLHPTHNYVDAFPVKLFEYMAAGLPVVASDFPLWKEIVGSSSCGLLVDPMDPRAIADAIQWLLTHPEEAEKMGEQGRKAAFTRYNWESEERKLFDFYCKILGADIPATCK